PITVYLIVGEKAERGRVRGISGLHAPMVGREAEFAQLQAYFQETVAQKVWRATAVTGSAGIGKSRLQREFTAWVTQTFPETRLLAARCYTHTRTTPYYFIAGLMRSLFNLNVDMPVDTAVTQIRQTLRQFTPNLDETELAYQLGSLASVLGLTIPDDPMTHLAPEQRRDRTFLSLERILLAASGGRPLLLLIDDLHWADALSLDFLERLLQLIQQGQIAGHAAHFFILSRPAENPDSALARLLDQLNQPPHCACTLTALDSDQSEQLVAALLDQQIPPALLRLIQEHAQGNPFYVEEILRSFIEDGTLKPNGGDQWRVTRPVADVKIPGSVQDIIAARLDRLPPENKRITQRAAVIGRTFWQQLLARITGSESVNDALTLLELRQLAERLNQSQLAEDWEWVFHHVLIQEVAYGAVPKAARRDIHQQVAQALEEQLTDNTGFLPPLIAFHYEEGNLPEKAIEYLQKSAEQAAAQYANEDAIAYYSRALALLDDLAAESPLTSTQEEQQYALLLGRVNVYHLTGRRDEQLANLDRLQSLTTTLAKTEYQAEAALRFADYYHAISDYATAVEFAQKAVTYAETANHIPQKIEGLSAWARSLIFQGELEDALQMAEKTRALARESHNSDYESAALSHMGIIHYYRDEYQPAQTAYEAALNIARKSNNLQNQAACLTNLISATLKSGDSSKALVYAEDALQITQLIGARSTEIAILVNLGVIHHDLGIYETAQHYFERSLIMSRTIQDRFNESLSTNNLGLVYFDLGNYKQAEKYVRSAVQIDRSIGDRIGLGYSLTTLARVLSGIHNLTESEQYHQEAMTLRHNLGQEAAMTDNLAGLADIAQQKGHLNTAISYTNKALDWLEEHGVDGVEYPLQVYLICANILTIANKKDKANQVLATAYQFLQKRASHISDTQARQSFLQNVPLHQKIVSLYTQTGRN
ncbi:MAG: tetratricopeptide repeat protein, partial [Chloroflexi bacterium]|nr:tetratricopeptide repeat protein [Chloroflexota bacterium]